MELDVRGEMCPYPAMKAKDALKKLPQGEFLDVLTDHAPALSTVPWEGAKLNFTSEIEVARNGEWRIHLERAVRKVDQGVLLGEISRRANELTAE